MPIKKHQVDSSEILVFNGYTASQDGYLLVQNATDDGVEFVENTPAAVGVLTGVNLLHKLDATAAPATSNDTTEGYAVGSKWVDVTNDNAYLCVDATEDAAVWLKLNVTDGVDLLHKLDATAAPAAGDDSADGYSVGSKWIDVTNDNAYICVDASEAAAVWLKLNVKTGVDLLHKLDATAAPTSGDDSADGYSVGSKWVDVTNDNSYLCVDATEAAAVWNQIDGAAGSTPNEEVWSSPGTDTLGDIIVLKGAALSATPRGGGTANTPSGYDLKVFCNGVKMNYHASPPTSTEEYYYDSVNNEIDVYASGGVDRYDIVYTS